MDETQELVGVSSTGEFVVLENWSLQGDGAIGPYPMFYAIYRTTGALLQFAEIPTLMGLARKDMDEAYATSSKAKWKEIATALEKAGFKKSGFEELKPEFDAKGNATLRLSDGRTVHEESTVLPRKKNDLQRESISLWLTEKNGKKSLLKKNAISIVVRSFSHRRIQKAYWLPESKTLVAFYNEPSQNADGRSTDLWVHTF